ncbi:hypothetical protein J32TS6_09880 [Virgibacillus pantothenticus]|uniref:Uncharacterized protein n=1 Tax=Virgibacillus pantothenticus TaxID=1473 RepID=A0A0L0QMX5_VIRPA|nr:MULTISPECIES: hypothetical protein [Virgibacillus]API93580.1 hypothetical protein BKP57_18240 [Virgibacillus sp. 6R]KNE19874.1 hypothetical protein AFK71_15760 [Virgibacillus pantothenticus]MBS7430030.1 hypothetical protein [Virgibacillus sp. 19R1-5]MBU8564873.1 hypothetical protein [Virgibacillus pantothenticus]MBU8599181.1 hypothetical protein [Virgibacillus pantothenticus]
MDKVIHNLDLHSKGIWFPITISIVLALIMLFVPKKHITWKELYAMFGIIAFITWVSDAIIGRTLDLIDLGNPKTAGLAEILVYTFVPSSLSILFSNYYTSKNKWLLVLIFTIIASVIEWIMVQLGYLKYKGWNPLISITVYIIAFGFLIPAHIKMLRT